MPSGGKRGGVDNDVEFGGKRGSVNNDVEFGGKILDTRQYIDQEPC
jgi:hypothetical protein